MASCSFQLLFVCALFGTGVLHIKGNEILKRTRRSTPIVYDIYALDHFIELVEKIERNVTRAYDVATYTRQLGYDSDYWTTLVGTALPLPSGILTSKEKEVLRKMVAHRYDRSRELGVVITSAGKTVAIGHVINGICAGLSRNKRVSLATWSPGAEKEVDNLYGATISRDLAQAVLAKKQDPSLPYFGPDGLWNNNDCPASYTRSSSVTTGASNAELLGDIDGFILGYYIPQWVRRGVRLGQLFRMYYSTGICYDMSVASCKRYNKFKSLIDDESLLEEISGIAEAIYLKDSTSYPNVKKADIAQATKFTVEKFLPYVEKLQNNQQCPKKKEGCELPANLVFVMDESTSIKGSDFNDQKDFVRDIIDAFNISPRQTRVSIVEFSSSAAIDIDLNEYGSKTRLKCSINQLRQKGGWTHTAEALGLVKDQIYLPLQKGQSTTSKSDVSNIMILLTDGKSNDGDKSALARVVREMKRDVKDLTMISVGVGRYDHKELELIATDPYKHVFTANDFTELLKLVKRLQTRTCTTPVQMELNFKEDGNNTVVTAYVYPGSVRYFALAPQFFYGVKDIDIVIKPVFGSLKIYASRIADTPGPTNYTYKLDPIPIGQSMSLHISDPCAGYNVTTCPPVFLAIQQTKLTVPVQNPSVPSLAKLSLKSRKVKAVQSKCVHRFCSWFSVWSCSTFLSLGACHLVKLALTGFTLRTVYKY